MAELAEFLAEIEGFEWDAGNTTKNVVGHGVTQAEAEEIFIHYPVLVIDDVGHSVREHRFIVHGSTNAQRLLTAAFTIRGKRVRIISVRDMSRKERKAYEKAG